MLMALYESARAHPETEMWSFKDVAAIYGINWQHGWLIELQRELREEGLIRGPSNGQNDDMAIGKLSGAGLRQIESEYEELDGVPTLIERAEDRSSPLQISDAVSASTADEVTLTYHPPAGVDSSRWTGIEQRLARDPSAVRHIQSQIMELDRSIETLGLSNHERAKVKAITEALSKLVESPEPEWKVIVDLLRSPTLNAVLSVAQIAQLALKLIFGIG